MTLVLKLFRITFLAFGGVDSSFARKRSASGCKTLASSSGTPYASTACSRAYTLVAGPDSLTVAAGDAWRVITPFNAAEAPYPCTALSQHASETAPIAEVGCVGSAGHKERCTSAFTATTRSATHAPRGRGRPRPGPPERGA